MLFPEGRVSRYNCEVCLGRGLVRLPLYKSPRVSPSSALAISASVDLDYRDYACPECSDVTPVVRVHAMHAETHVASYVEDPAFVGHVQDILAHQLAAHLLRNDYIEFRRGPEDTRELQWQMIATIGVVPKSKLDDIEQRVAARQTDVAREAIEEAKFQVSNWGSHYGRSEILKRDAVRLIGESLQRAIDKRAAVKVMPLYDGSAA
jgi:hypothetical protein